MKKKKNEGFGNMRFRSAIPRHPRIEHIPVIVVECLLIPHAIYTSPQFCFPIPILQRNSFHFTSFFSISFYRFPFSFSFRKTKMI